MHRARLLPRNFSEFVALFQIVLFLKFCFFWHVLEAGLLVARCAHLGVGLLHLYLTVSYITCYCLFWDVQRNKYTPYIYQQLQIQKL